MRCRCPTSRYTASFIVAGLVTFVVGTARLGLFPVTRDGKPRRLSGCGGDQEEVAACNMAPCSAVLSPAVDCAWDSWSSWTQCGCDGIQTRSRATLTQSRNGGQLCSGPSKQLQPCEGTCARRGAVDCEIGTWEPWSDCTKSCLGGQQYRTREILRQPQHGGQTCSGFLDETQHCNTQECPGILRADCRWDDWGDWDACTVSCGSGQSMRLRVVKVQPANGGQLCDALTSSESAECNLGSCTNLGSEDCMWSMWASWSLCSKTCGRGEQYRSRSIARAASEGGAGCAGVFEEYEECQEVDCPSNGRDCQLGPWTRWSDCSSTCQGHHSRARSIAVQAENGGKPCTGGLEEMRPCNEQQTCGILEVDCVYQSWLPWSFCSRSCGGGTRARRRGIAKHAEGSGKQCEGDTEQVQPCKEEPCIGAARVDCSWAPWGTWSSCTATCGQAAERRRERSVAIEAQNYGKPCQGGDAIEFDACNQPLCEAPSEVCEWSSWGDWSGCTRSGVAVKCGGGQRKRSRASQLRSETLGHSDSGQSLLSAKAIGSNGTGSRRLSVTLTEASCKEFQDDLQSCAQTACDGNEPLDCMWGAWQEWSSCPCSGMHERHRSIAGAAQYGGKPCKGPEVEAEPCLTDCGSLPLRDCEYSEWTQWSACPVTCGGGGTDQDTNLVRYRTVTQFPQGGGRSCNGGVVQEQPCALSPCPEKIDCAWGDWSEYSACTATCGGGETSRSRQIERLPQHGGRTCDRNFTMVVEMCNTEACPQRMRNCEFSLWNDWQDCSVPCGGGQQHRSRIILVEATEGGRPCTGALQDFQECGTSSCDVEAKIPCSWGVWGSWSACTALCNGHQERHRSVKSLPKKGGAACQGPEKIIRGCNLDSSTCRAEAPEDCVISSWSSWSNCTRACDGGQQTRSRSVKVHAQNLGKPCNGSLAHTQPCNTQPCSGEEAQHDCKWGIWEDWDACTKSCEGGQRTRRRSIFGEAMGDGHACKASHSMEVEPCNKQSCFDLAEVCGWSDWGPYGDCSKSCGSGQMSRIRQKEWTSTQASGRQLTVATNTESCVGAQKQIEPCGLLPCDESTSPIPCKWKAWGDWGSCSCNGLRNRVRAIASQLQNGGLPCVGPLEESKSCVPDLSCSPLNEDCEFGDWTSWSECSATCDGGQSYHTRTVVKHAEAWGAGCQGGLEEMRPCKTLPCGDAQDCKYTDWTAWSACSKTCDGGQHVRSRSVSSYPKEGGRACTQADLEEVGACAEGSCVPDAYGKTDCSWSTWASWSSCPASCGVGQVRRSRIVVQQAAHGGAPCNGFFEEFRNCTLQACPQKDCQFDAWSSWSTCSDKCTGHQMRSRGFKAFAIGGGASCTGSTKELQPCGDMDDNFCISNRASVDCKLSDWSMWSVCSRECGGGQRTSSRQIAAHPLAGGKPCQDSLKRVEACNEIYCPGDQPVDCTLGSWGAFEACSASCGGGQMRRDRGVATEPRNGGVACASTNTTQVVPCNTHPCSGGELCTWTTWTAWSECSASCDGGETKRHRALVSSDAMASPAITGLEEIGSSKLQPVLQQRLVACSLAVIGSLALLYAAVAGPSRRSLQEEASMTFRWLSSEGHQATRYAALGTEDPVASGEEDEEIAAVANQRYRLEGRQVKSLT